ncbi:hypothetical protein GCM10007100_02600 [Roseibacillus persicicus]|uniref:Uncharacterized protein n=1 Tax=Roseibacillus persicicus TaxID=454148 RepID=A0A918TEQ5_9BACT|nr:hypothetical protein GCM10007100_02600 [Roseibacillus persicicus]
MADRVKKSERGPAETNPRSWEQQRTSHCWDIFKDTPDSDFVTRFVTFSEKI